MQNKANKVNQRKKFRVKRGMRQVLISFVVWMALLIVFAAINPNFFSLTNIGNLLRQIVPILIIGIAQSYVMITGNIDLSIGSVVGMSSMISATLLSRGIMEPISACVVALLCCLCMGLVNGAIIAYGRVPSFIATLGTQIIARGIAQLVNGNYNTDAITKIFPESAYSFKQILYYGKTLGLYNGVWIAVALWVLFAFILNRTRMGYSVYAVGSNREASKFAGVNIRWTIVMVYLISAFCSFVVGVIVCASIGQGIMDAGLSYEMHAVSSAVIGGVSTLGGQGTLMGCVVGAAVWGTLQNGLQFAGAPVAVRNIIVGVIMLSSVWIDIAVRIRLQERTEAEPDDRREGTV